MTAQATMRFGVVGRMPRFDEVERVALLAEEAGFDLLGVGDSQSLFGDTYVHLALAARATTRIRLTPCVTNIVTRHPGVTASAIGTVDDVSGGRALLALSIGDSAVLNLGLRPARLSELEEGIVALRGLMAGEEITFQGMTAHVRSVTRPVPIYVAAEGPGSVAMAARQADGVFLNTGLTPEVLDRTSRWLARGLDDAGRSPDELEVWHQARAVVAEDREAALHRLRAAMASMGHHGLSNRFEEKLVPPERVPALKELSARYDPSQHVVPGDSVNARLVEELGLVEFLANRYAIGGSPRECADRVVDLCERGVNNLLLAIVDEDMPGVVEAWGSEVMPLVRERLAKA